jgi:hypothetical protein
MARTQDQGNDDQERRKVGTERRIAVALLLAPTAIFPWRLFGFQRRTLSCVAFGPLDQASARLHRRAFWAGAARGEWTK